LRVPSRCLSLQGKLKLHSHGLLPFRRSQSLRSVVHGPDGPELLDVGRRIRMVRVFWIGVRHGVFVKVSP
jgi:hypothetical protein